MYWLSKACHNVHMQSLRHVQSYLNGVLSLCHVRDARHVHECVSGHGHLHAQRWWVSCRTQTRAHTSVYAFLTRLVVCMLDFLGRRISSTSLSLSSFLMRTTLRFGVTTDPRGSISCSTAGSVEGADFCVKMSHNLGVSFWRPTRASCTHIVMGMVRLSGVGVWNSGVRFGRGGS